MRIVFFYFAVCFLCACGSEKGGGNGTLDTNPRPFANKVTLVPEDTLVIPVGSYSNIYSRCVKKCRINGHSYLGVVNEKTNDLEFYSLEDPKDNFSIHYDEDGPNGIYILKAFEVISDSTLLVGSSYRRQLYISDFSGNIIRTMSDQIERKGKPYVPIYYTNLPLMYNKKKNDFYIFTKVDTDYFGPGIWSGTMFLKISDNPNGPSTHVFELPSHFEDYIYGGRFSHSSHLLVRDRYLVLGIPFYNNLLVYDLENGELRKKAAGSKYFGDTMPWSKPDSERDEEIYVHSNSYRELAYDEENGIMYRIAYRGVDYIGADSLRRNWDNKPPSVIILDKDFEKVGEVDLPVNTIYTRTYFTHNGKLYLSINHPDNNPSEDEMVFVGFKPEKL